MVRNKEVFSQVIFTTNGLRGSGKSSFMPHTLPLSLHGFITNQANPLFPPRKHGIYAP